MPGYLLNTSVFVAAEQQRPLSTPPAGAGRISVATLTELGVGVQRATTQAVRMRRQGALVHTRGFVPLPYDEAVADRLAEILAAARDRGRRAGAMDAMDAMDAIIAATALVHDLTVWTQDDDFAVLADLAPALVVKRG